ncbi:MAG: hypothetical protein ACJ71Q_09130 [Terriglobales bacterium]
MCGNEFILTRSDKRTCSRRCGIKHQHNKLKEPTQRDLLTGLLIKTVSPEDEQLYSADEGTHLFDEAVLTRTGAGVDEWAQDSWNEAEWPAKLHPTSKAQSKKASIVAAAQRFIETEKVMTLRHLHYLLVSTHITKNTKGEYAYVSDVITEARERGDIPYHAIRDGVRNSVTFNTWENPSEFAESVAGAYRKDIWKGQHDAVEIWFEKDSVLSVVEDIAKEYYVTMRPMRGHASTSFLYENAAQISTVDRNLYIYYFGDHDPSGYCIERSARDRLIYLLLDEFGWTLAGVANKLRWRRLGFLEDDFLKPEFNVQSLDITEKKDKAAQDAFVREFGSTDAAELEALPPHELRKRVTDAIESHLNVDQWHRMKTIEQIERESWLNTVSRCLDGEENTRP